MEPKQVLQSSGRTLLSIGVVIAFFTLVCTSVNWVGRSLKSSILYHEQEHAHCYTASKLFSVDIACVPKK